MEANSRRTFLRQSASALTAIAATRCAPADAVEDVRNDLAREVETLEAIGGAVLPSELGEGGRARVVAGFRSWLAGFEPVAELSHGYGTSEIRYGPEDPASRWTAQLQALALEAERRYQRSFSELSIEQRREMLRRLVGGEEELPAPQYAPHVAVGLMAYYFGSPGAEDLCYRAQIGRFRCRGLQTGPARPAPLSPGE